MKAVIFGYSGLVGSHLLNHLINNKRITDVICIGRGSNNQVKHSKVEYLNIDFETMHSLADDFKADMVFCCLGTTIKKAGSQQKFQIVDLYYPTEICRLAKLNDVQHFAVISSVGADANSSNFYLRTKGEMEAAVMQININNTHIFRPGLLLGARKEWRFGERVAAVVNPAINPLLTGRLRKFRAVGAHEVAAALLQSVLSESGTQINHYDEIKFLSKQLQN